VKLHPQADRDMAETAIWYDRQELGVGDEFLDAVQAAIQTVSLNPSTGSPVTKTLRMQSLRRFPLGLVFCERAEDVYVIAVHHFSKDSKYWTGRLKSPM
jgi:toxin ParE1/3/4